MGCARYPACWISSAGYWQFLISGPDPAICLIKYLFVQLKNLPK